MTNKMERFTQRARRVFDLAQEEAERLHHGQIGTEHLLLGLMREEGGVAGRVLRDLGAEMDRVVELVAEYHSQDAPSSPQTPDLAEITKDALERAILEASRMGHRFIGTEHLLLGLVRQTEGGGIEILKQLAITPEEVRRKTRQVLHENPVQGSPETPDEPSPRSTTTEAVLRRFGINPEEVRRQVQRGLQDISERSVPDIESSTGSPRGASVLSSRANYFYAVERLLAKIIEMVKHDRLTGDQGTELLAAMLPKPDLPAGKKIKVVSQFNLPGHLPIRQIRLTLTEAETGKSVSDQIFPLERLLDVARMAQEALPVHRAVIEMAFEATDIRLEFSLVEDEP